MSITQEQVESALKTYQDPYLQTDYLTANAIKSISINANQISLEINLGYPAANLKSLLVKSITEHLKLNFKTQQINVAITAVISPYQTQAGMAGIPQVKNIIAVASGKGGVGKSTTAVNLALALHAEGANVGILDADIYGPNQPHMLGVQDQPDIKSQQGLKPIVRHGLQSISIGYLIDPATPMVWRGPMVSQALQQLLYETAWENLDYLIIDLPPGTGDVQLTLAQKIPVSGAVIVTTPQDIALLDARKGLEMFRKVKIPVLGIIENMSTHVCRQCGHEEAIFGTGGAERLAEAGETEVLGILPLDISIRENADQGKPTVVADPSSHLAQRYIEIARRMSAKLSLQRKSYASKFPKIVIE